MKLIKVNNHELVICTPAEAEERGFHAYFQWPDVGLVTITYLNNGDIASLAGLDGKTFDWGLPIDWYSVHPEHPEYVYLYEPGSLGQPFNFMDSVRRMGPEIKAQYEAQLEFVPC